MRLHDSPCSLSVCAFNTLSVALAVGDSTTSCPPALIDQLGGASTVGGRCEVIKLRLGNSREGDTAQEHLRIRYPAHTRGNANWGGDKPACSKQYGWVAHSQHNCVPLAYGVMQSHDSETH
ncbi:hypothetical protein F4802DRAFT_300985 [Xylaria palmicola]|nr:hypothetical protein F4802DRAFT_300985 [Xylaria palmicola]